MADNEKSVLYFVRDNEVLLFKKGEDAWQGAYIEGTPASYDGGTEAFRPTLDIGMVPMHTEKIAEQTYVRDDASEDAELMHAYKCDEWSGELKVPEGYDAKWFSNEDLPYESMLPDRHLWLPSALGGVPMEGTHVVDQVGNTIHHSIVAVDEMPDDAPTSK